MLSLVAPNARKDAILPNIRELMKGRLFGPEEWMDRYGCELEVIPFPWGTEDLESACPFNPGMRVFETHVAFLGTSARAGQPSTILGIDDLEQSRNRCTLFGRSFIADARFASREAGNDRWYLMLADPFARRLPYPRTLAACREDLASCGYEQPLAVEEFLKRVLFPEHDPQRHTQAIAFTRSEQDGRPVIIASVERGIASFWSQSVDSTCMNGIAASRLLP